VREQRLIVSNGIIEIDRDGFRFLVETECGGTRVESDFARFQNTL
jgi:hypothetical protein